MSLAPGTQVGPYEIVAPLGAGGMGEVYRARDVRLRREVAIKVLPETFAKDPERVARFAREAHLLATLNHPNIGGIYGLEESSGIQALVLELVEGPTLAERLTAGPIPLDETLAIALQICEALEAAHEKGIIHRDLKPANIKLAPDGRVKVLDFGLAKALIDDAAADAATSPTLTAVASRLGVIVGTAAYMSPEQAKGKAVDRRTDIWAFGCVLYEMLTGRSAFGGETISEIMARILEREPDWSALPPLPMRVRDLLRRCLQKHVSRRLQHIGDARIEIEDAGRAGAATQPADATAVPRPRWSRRWQLAASAGLLTGLVVAAAVARWGPSPQRASSDIRPPLLRATIELPPAAPLALQARVATLGYDSPLVALSPDGTHLAYTAKVGSDTMLYLREMASGDVRPVAGTEGAIHAFFSPDTQWIGFLTNDRVRKVPVRGGAAITICEARVPVLAWWPRGSVIYFTEHETFRLSRVPAEGGRPERILDGMAETLSFSDVWPDGRSVLATRLRGIGGDFADIVRVNLDTREIAVLVRSGYGARYVEPGYLLFGRAGNLLAVRFDPDRQAVSSEPMIVAANVAMESLFRPVHATSSRNGLLAYVPGGDLSIGKLAWVERDGTTHPLDVPPRVYGVIDVAPDGKTLAVHVADVKDYVWIYDVERRAGRRLASEEAVGWPLWSPDGRWIAVQAVDTREAFVRDAEEGGAIDRRVAIPGTVGGLASWSRTSGVLAMSYLGTTWHIGFLAPNAAAVTPAFDGWFPSFSPDGHWLAYSSAESSALEVLIGSYPDGKVIRQVSPDGGIEPLWNPSGELFYRIGGRWFSARVSTDPEPRWDPPRLAFETEYIETPGRSYDVSSDGRRLFVVKPVAPMSRSTIHIIVNWFEGVGPGG